MPEDFSFTALLLNIGLAVLIAGAGWIIAGWTASLVLRTVRAGNYDQALGRFLSQMGRWTVLAGAGIASLQTVGIETTSFVALLASAGFAVGLALQGSLSNFASGVMILIFRPFDLGDVITAAGITGAVVDIGIFATTLHTPDNQKIIVPNSAITGGTIVNITTLGTRRGGVDVGVAYGADVSQVIQILEEAAATVECVHTDPAPAIAFVGLGASSLDFTILTWADSGDYLTMLHEVRKAAYEALNANDIEIPYNHLVVQHSQLDAAVAAAK